MTLAALGRAAGPLDRLDPRARVLAAGVCAMAIVALSSLFALLAALALTVGLAALARLPVGATLRRLAMVDGFILVLLATLPFTTPGAPVFTLFGLPASAEGLGAAAEIGLTANAVVLAMMALIGALPPTTFAAALAGLGVPAKLVHLMRFALRYIDVLEAEQRRLRMAMAVRGFRMRNTVPCWCSLGWLVGMLFVRAVERAERVMDAMTCRGFDGRLYAPADGRFTGADARFAAALGASLIGLMLIERL